MNGIRAVAAVATLLAAPAVASEIIYQTQGPFGGMFGLWGPDVSRDQRVATRFTADADYLLDRVSVWFMDNAGPARPRPRVRLSLQTSAGLIPSGVALERWEYSIQAVGWSPVLEASRSVVRPALRAGESYWIVAESDDPGGEDAVWNFAAFGNSFNAFDNLGSGWSSGPGAALTAIVEATRLCPADWNADGTVDFNDFLAFLNDYNAGAPRADLNGDGVVDFNDFLAFLNLYNTPC
ncbi:MAG: hypothetical protein FJ255_12545 [Phycisphaerae bacterium]|nr:hypothetical protein [Phycisphaerae bacterium]